jgi:hypothetical protein
LTEDIGYRLSWIYALEKRVTYGTKTTIYQFADEQSIYDVGALPEWGQSLETSIFSNK